MSFSDKFFESYEDAYKELLERKRDPEMVDWLSKIKRTHYDNYKVFSRPADFVIESLPDQLLAQYCA